MVKHRETNFSTAIASPGDTIRHITGGPNNSGVQSFPYGQHTAKDAGNSSATYQNPTLISANTVVLDSDEGDIAVIGSGVRATQDLTLLARQGNIDVRSGQERSRHYEKHESRTIGNLGSNAQDGVTGNSNTIGVRKTKSELNADQALESTVRSSLIAGRDLTLEAEQDIGIHGADLAAGRDMALTGRSVTVDPGEDATRTSQRSSMDQFGITAAVNSPILSAVQTAQQMERASRRTDDARMQALAATTAAIAAGNAYHAVQSNPAQAGGIGGSLTVGAASTDHRSEQFRQDYSGSTLHAGRDMTVTAQGGGDASDIQVVGSDLQAGRDFTLRAEDEIELRAAQNRFTQQSDNKSSSWGVGVAAQYGAGGFGMGITANASTGRGNTDGEDISHTNTHVAAGNVFTLESGGDTNLKGAVASGKQVIADVGGDLNIESLQDTSTYESKQRSIGGSLSIGYGRVGGSFNFSKTDIDSTFASVTEQSGIRAGDDGFQIVVAGNTGLKGAIIASTDIAVEDDKNRLTTGTLTAGDIDNRAEYEADASGVALGVGSQGGVPNLSGAGIGSDEGKAASVTRSTISGGIIEIADSDAQQRLTGQDATTAIAALNRDAHVNEAGEVVDSQGRSTASSIAPIFDAEKVTREINAQVQITEAFSQQAHHTVGTYVQTTRNALREQLNSAGTEEERNTIQLRLDNLLLEERVLNVLIGAVTGNGGSALAKESLSAAADEMRRIMIEDSKTLGVVDAGGETLSNLSGKSVGVRGDGIKLGGTRIDLDLLCGTDNSRCAIQKTPDGTPLLDAEGKTQLALNNGQVQFLGSLEEFIKTPEGQKMVGLTGGVQGMKGMLFGFPYEVGSWQDKLVEAFAGTHDYIGGSLSGLYDDHGNATRGRSPVERQAQDTWSATGAIALSTPFAAAEFLPSEVWQAISILLRAAK